MESPRLTDFTQDELLYIGALLLNDKENLLKALATIESMDSDLMKQHLHESFSKRLDMCIRWDTKVIEAHVELKTKELSTLN